MDMNNLKFLSLVVITCPILSSQGLATDYHPDDILSRERAYYNNITLSAGDIFNGKSTSDFLKIEWQDSEDSIIFSSLKIIKHPKSLTDLTLLIPGQINGKSVEISTASFKKLSSETLKLHLIFKEINGVKVKMPNSLDSMFAWSGALYSIDFSGVIADKVTSLYRCFLMCKNISALDLRPFECSLKNSIDIAHCFCRCDNLKWINIRNMTLSDEELNYAFMTPNDLELRFIGIKNRDEYEAEYIKKTHDIIDSYGDDEEMPDIYKWKNYSFPEKKIEQSFDIKNKTETEQQSKIEAKKTIESSAKGESTHTPWYSWIMTSVKTLFTKFLSFFS